MIMKKKITFPYLILSVLVILLTIVVVMGVFTYNKFSEIVRDVNQSSRPDLMLVTTKNLLGNLSNAGNSVKTYTLTKDTIYLDKFYKAITQANETMELIYSINDKKHNELLNIPKLDTLVNLKIVTLEDLLSLQDDYRVNIALNKVMDKIEKQNEAEAEKGIFRRIFSKNKISKTKVSEEINQIKNEETHIKNTLVNKELELINQDRIITDNIRTIIDVFEITENNKIANETQLALIKVEKINKQIAIFCIAGGILVLFISYLMMNFIRTNIRFRTALREAKNQAEELADAKERFLNNVSHEIRTPMNAISGFADQLAENELPPEQKEQVNMIQKSSKHLLHIINEVLTFNKLQQGKSAKENIPFNPAEVTSEVVAILNPLALEKNITINIINNDSIPKVLKGDPHKLSQILLNIVGNSIKFSEDGNIGIKLSPFLANHESVSVRFEIQDNGIGMTAKQMKKIFEEFEQAEVSTTRKHGGTGLGLSITKMLVDLLKGNISVQSELNKGTLVTVELPFEIAQEEEIKNITVQKSQINNNIQLKDINILIVDDEPYNRKLLTTILKKHDVSLSEAENGQQAIDEITKNNYDIILMDSRMPVLNGIDATKKIRRSRNKKISSIPIIALSAAVSEQDQANYKKAGMNDFLSKPFKKEDLIYKIHSVLNNKKTSTPKRIRKAPEKNEPALLDFNQLKSISGGDKNFYTEMLQTFVEGTEEGIDKINQHTEEKNWQMVAEYAHKISSPCNHLSANNLYKMLKDIEDYCREEKNIKAALPIIKNLPAEANKVILKVKNELKKVA